MIVGKRYPLLLMSVACALCGCQQKNPVSEVSVPTLAYDDTSITLTWHKPDNYAGIVDYRVYQNGKAIGLASENNTLNNPAKPYIDVFYQHDKDGFQHKITYQNFKVTGLKPHTQYQFTVTAVYQDGSESKPSPVVKASTAQYGKTVNIADYGAVGDGATVNTANIQHAIDDCAAKSTSAYGCHVVVPGNRASGHVFVTGALFLKSNMTLDVQKGATLKGSPHWEDYPLAQGYQLYSYRTNKTDSRRPPSLLNALSADHRNAENHSQHGYDDTRGAFENIRVVGQGTLDGNGWVRNGSTIDEVGNTLPYHKMGSRQLVYSLGILAKDQMIHAYQQYNPDWDGDTSKVVYLGQINKDLYANRRSALATFRGVKNFYIGGLTIHNPAYHGIMFLESQNVVMAYTRTQTFDINNADGVEFGNSSDFDIFANFIDSGDDCINFAAGQGTEYEHGNPTANGWVFNNYTREGHGVLVAGSHTGAGIKDILAEDNVAFLTNNGLRLKSTLPTGGGGYNIVFRDTAMRDIGTHNTETFNGVTITNRDVVGNPFVMTLAYKAGDNVFTNAKKPASFHDITIQNVTVDNVDNTTSAGQAIKIDGYDGKDPKATYPKTYHQQVLFDNVKMRNVKVTQISQLKDSTFRNVTIENWEKGYASPWQISDSDNLTFDHVTPDPTKQ